MSAFERVVSHPAATIARELRYAARALRATPAFSIGAIGTVALSIGATTAIFSVVYGVLLRQLPFREAERVFWIWSDQPGRDRMPFNVPDFIDYRDTERTLDGFAGYFTYSANLGDGAAAERVPGLRATGNFFDVLGVRPRLGRLLTPDDERTNARVVILSEGFWQRRYAGDPAIVGRAIALNGESYTVAGVLPAGFASPIREADIVVPFSPDQDPRRGARNSVNFIHGAGRLAGGVSRAQAAEDLARIARRLQQQFPVENARKRGVQMVAALDGISGPFRTPLLALAAAVGVVLLITCANLANLMLTRAAGRRKQVALQLAIGASRASVIRSVLIEALLVAAGGGALGVLLATWGTAALLAMVPSQLPRASEIGVDMAVMVFALAASVATAVLFGAAPALAAGAVDVREALQSSARGLTRGGRGTRAALVSAEVALSFALLVAMTMLARSFANAQSVTPGFDTAGTLSARITLPARRYATRAAIVTFQDALADRLRELPAIAASGAVSSVPLSGVLARIPFTVEGRPLPRERVPLAQFRLVAGRYFEAARIPIVRGRLFTDADTERTRPVAIVNETLAAGWLDGIEPIGARLLIDDNNDGPRPVEVIGVVGNVQQVAIDGGPTPDVYLPYAQMHADTVGIAAANMFWVARTNGNPLSVTPVIAAAIRRIDADVVASPIRPLGAYVSESLAPRRFSVELMALFAVAAMLLAVSGIYAVTAYAVGQRERELSVRVALGATRSGIVRLILGDGARALAIGLASGLVLAAVSARLLTALLFGVAPTDPAAFVQAGCAVAGAALLASVIPALRAANRTPGALGSD